jgi:DNA-binding transcriptional regulator YhcF (GntR family)
VEFDNSRPIWLQLVDELSRRIVTGTWAPGAKVDSVRELAAEFGVNPNTVQRALARLDESGLTTTARTSGRFVTADPSRVDAQRTRQARQLTDALVSALRDLGLSRDEALTLLQTRWAETEKEA